MNVSLGSTDAQLEGLTLEQLLDATIDPNSRLMRIELEIISQFQQRGYYIGGALRDQIMAAVYDGQGWSDLMKTFGGNNES